MADTKNNNAQDCVIKENVGGCLYCELLDTDKCPCNNGNDADDDGTQNKSLEELKQLYEQLRESIRHYISAKLTDTSEENPMEVSIELVFGCFGMSTLEMLNIDRIFQQPGEGIIWVRFEGDERYTEFDELDTEDLISIASAL